MSRTCGFPDRLAVGHDAAQQQPHTHSRCRCDRVSRPPCVGADRATHAIQKSHARTTRSACVRNRAHLSAQIWLQNTRGFCPRACTHTHAFMYGCITYAHLCCRCTYYIEQRVLCGVSVAIYGDVCNYKTHYRRMGLQSEFMYRATQTAAISEPFGLLAYYCLIVFFVLLHFVPN